MWIYRHSVGPRWLQVASRPPPPLSVPQDNRQSFTIGPHYNINNFDYHLLLIKSSSLIVVLQMLGIEPHKVREGGSETGEMGTEKEAQSSTQHPQSGETPDFKQEESQEDPRNGFAIKMNIKKTDRRCQYSIKQCRSEK